MIPLWVIESDTIEGMNFLRLGPLVVLVGCLDVTVPQPPPPPGAGTIQGTVTFPVPGRATTKPAGGATVTLVGTSRQAVADAESGRFVLEGITRSVGQLLFSYDADRDGKADRQKLLELANVGAGPGKTVALGEVVLGTRGAVAGRVLRDDVSGPTGHAGASVFVAGLPLATSTTDTGEFLLENLPEGPVTVSFFRAGYLPESVKVGVRSGQEENITPVRLKVDPMGLAAAVARVTGTLRFEDETPVAAARVQFVSGALRLRTTTTATGAFELVMGQAALYQVGIEAEGAQSLILNNVLLLPGTNDLGSFPLTRGTSTPIDFDGGFNPGTPDAGNIAIARIEPRELVVPPGGTGVLSSGQSTGQRPITSRWSSPSADGGAGLVFDSPVTPGLSTRFTAPDASGAFAVTLNITDALGNESQATSTVRVGVAPTVKLSVDGGSSDFEVDDFVTLEADGTVADGTPVTKYRWTQLSGPSVTNVAEDETDSFSFRAPFVASRIPMAFQVEAQTATGIWSAPLEVTITVRPRGMPYLEVTADRPTVTWTGAESDSARLVGLTATLRGAPPGTPLRYDWSPINQFPCGTSDGGPSYACASAVTLVPLTNGSGRAKFIAPQVSGNRDVTFSVSVSAMAPEDGGGIDGGVIASGSVTVAVKDQRLPSCVLERSRLSVRVFCDEPLDGGAFDKGSGRGELPPHSVSLVNPPQFDGGLAVFYLESYPDDVSGLNPIHLTDFANNEVMIMRTAVTPDGGLFTGPVLTATNSGLSQDAGSAVTSTTNPRPMWVTPPASTGGPAERFVLARHTSDAGVIVRSVWLSAPSACPKPPCHALQLPIMTGTLPAPNVSSVMVGDRAYLITSAAQPNALVRVRGGTSFEFMPSGMPPLLGLSAVGNELWVLGATDAGSLFRQRVKEFSDGGFVLSQADVIVDGGYIGGPVDVVASPDGFQVAAAVSIDGVNGQELTFFDLDQMVTPASWTPRPSPPLPSAVGVRGAWTGSRFTGAPSFVVTTADLKSYAAEGSPTFIESEPIFESDAVRFGDAVLVTWTGGTTRKLGLALVSDPFDPSSQLIWSTTPNQLGSPVTNAWNPRLTVMNGEVLLTWSELLPPNGPWVIRAQVIH